MLSKFKNIMNNLGPGLLYAGAAIGVSHLVGSTKAGAKYAFFLLIFIPLIHIIKYPFYKYGPQYTAITGRNILHGYKALGKWALGVYIGMTLLSMCLIQAAVTIVTSPSPLNFLNWIFRLSTCHTFRRLSSCSSPRRCSTVENTACWIR